LHTVTTKIAPHFETISDAASHKSINVLLSIAASESFKCRYQNSIFIFSYQRIIRSPSSTWLDPTLMPPIIKLNKCIYGLKQAAFEWRLLLDTTIYLKSFGFTQLQTNKCICKIDCVTSTYLDSLFHHYQFKNHFIFRCKLIIINQKNITILNQVTCLERFHIDQKLLKFPPKISFCSYDLTDDNPISLSKQDQSLFMKTVGSLLFLSTRSCPDISFNVNYVSLFVKFATIRQLYFAKRLLLYIGNSKNYNYNSMAIQDSIPMCLSTHLTLHRSTVNRLHSFK